MRSSIDQPHDTTKRGLDWPLVVFFTIAYVIPWAVVPVLGSIARQSGVADWLALSEMGEALDFGSANLSVPGWVIYLLTRLQDFAFSVAGLIMIAYLHGRTGLRELWRRLTNFRVGWRWYLAACIPYWVVSVGNSLVRGS